MMSDISVHTTGGGRDLPTRTMTANQRGHSPRRHTAASEWFCSVRASRPRLLRRVNPALISTSISLHPGEYAPHDLNEEGPLRTKYCFLLPLDHALLTLFIFIAQYIHTRYNNVNGDIVSVKGPCFGGPPTLQVNQSINQYHVY